MTQAVNFPLLLSSSATLAAAHNFHTLFRAVEKLHPLFGFTSSSVAVAQPGEQHLY